MKKHLKKSGPKPTITQAIDEAGDGAFQQEGLLMQHPSTRRPKSKKAQPSSTEEPEGPKVGRLVKPSSRYVFERMVVHPNVAEEIISANHFITHRKAIEKVWNLSSLTSIDRNVLNFYGDPGTGKTMLARCVARHLGKPLFIVDYAEVVSCMVGQTAKNIRTAFEEAKKYGAILFFDEADSLCSKRVAATDINYSTGINQNRNVFMQELDRYDGICLLATNFFGNFDEALLRRIASHIKFELPDAPMRTKLFDIHIPNKEMCVNLDLEKLGELSEGLSGGDILNVCINSIKIACLVSEKPEDWKLEQTMLLREIQRTMEAKRSHSGESHTPRAATISLSAGKRVGGLKFASDKK